mmetsp:Transcript_17031/g.51688  ORF Transcript_17031/g.51688 Transcript_17031/m.51688 type:complete len:246 (-) Transcript_17031:2-739(-)
MGYGQCLSQSSASRSATVASTFGLNTPITKASRTGWYSDRTASSPTPSGAPAAPEPAPAALLAMASAATMPAAMVLSSVRSRCSPNHTVPASVSSERTDVGRTGARPSPRTAYGRVSPSSLRDTASSRYFWDGGSARAGAGRTAVAIVADTPRPNARRDCWLRGRCARASTASATADRHADSIVHASKESCAAIEIVMCVPAHTDFSASAASAYERGSPRQKTTFRHTPLARQAAKGRVCQGVCA